MLEHLKLPACALKLSIHSSPQRTNTNETSKLANIVGQSRAQSALAFGIAMKAPGYNIFVMGEPGTGRL
jgi:predicted ATPase with chaperone activity